MNIGEVKAIGGAEGRRWYLEGLITRNQLRHINTVHKVATLRKRFVSAISRSAIEDVRTGGYVRGEK